MYCIFRSDNGCLVELYASREPDEGEIKLEYEGDLPGPSETLRYINGEILIVDLSDCESDESGDSFSHDDHLGIYVHMENDLNVPCKRSIVLPFDTLDMKHDSPDDGVIFDFDPNNGAVFVTPGTYFFNVVTLFYSNHNKVLKCLSILSNGVEVARRFVSSYKFRLNTFIMTGVVELTSDTNMLMLYINDTAKTSIREYVPWYGQGVKILGGKYDTFFYIIQL